MGTIVLIVSSAAAENVRLFNCGAPTKKSTVCGDRGIVRVMILRLRRSGSFPFKQEKSTFAMEKVKSADRHRCECWASSWNTGWRVVIVPLRGARLSKIATESGAFRLRANAADNNAIVFARPNGVRQRTPCKGNTDHSLGVSKTMLCHREHTWDNVKSPTFARRSSSVHNSVSPSRKPTELLCENISITSSAGKWEMGAKPPS
jgi:hypothetical protein